MNSTIETNKATATRFIEAFNTADWDTVREVVAPNYVFHHPVGGKPCSDGSWIDSFWVSSELVSARLLG
jgi:hypothetical protein